MFNGRIKQKEGELCSQAEFPFTKYEEIRQRSFTKYVTLDKALNF